MILDMNDAIDFGAYADIFRPSQGPLAFKLFISVGHETNVKQGLTGPQDHRRREMTFASECRAFEIAAQDPFLSEHVPHSFRRCDIAGVVEHGESVAANYLPPCCYAMDYIEGSAAKLAMVGHLPHIGDALRAFQRAGIGRETKIDGMWVAPLLSKNEAHFGHVSDLGILAEAAEIIGHGVLKARGYGLRVGTMHLTGLFGVGRAAQLKLELVHVSEDTIVQLLDHGGIARETAGIKTLHFAN
jgi:hypothetical protein